MKAIRVARHAEEEDEEDRDLLELARLLKQEEKVIRPPEERIEIVIPSAAEDMPGSDTDVVVHKLPWKGDCPLEKQNAGDMYQGAMVTLFHDVTHHDIECYDMIAKSQSEVGHLADRSKLFDRLKQFKLRLNSSQCTIRVQSGCSPTETVYAGSYHFVDFQDGSDQEGPDPESERVLMSDGEDKVNELVLPESQLNAPMRVAVYEAGILAVLPVEVQIPSLRVLMDVKLQEAEWVRTRYEELSLIEEKRLAAICHGQLYQQRMKRAFDKKVRPRIYHVGDMVLKRILPPQNDRRGKWTPNYEGPFVVKKVFSGGALLLTTMDGEDFPSPVNADAVKKYFV
ncbi:hypothetical protein KIW84_063325 [Lathyrus oleraceus]|uniref:Uncharacterized protein n=1 Tax=Pisum sativum TaxID=3888 RepID=A0A9D5A747_PEA|nr:hypothetical protein KIW84_063325 [Pisum sativum]